MLDQTTNIRAANEKEITTEFCNQLFGSRAQRHQQAQKRNLVSQIKLQLSGAEKAKKGGDNNHNVHERVKAIEQRIYNKSTSVDLSPSDRVLN